HKNHYPAIDVLASVSRLMNDIITPEQQQLSRSARELLATYREAEDLISIGAYSKGSNPKIDEAVAKIESLNSFLKQETNETDGSEDIWKKLAAVLSKPKNKSTRP
ncbi:MAG TPA: hypothetical protein VK106_06695, partial [Balneolaceae bacterium]|nr:hypothetical protein [Balneolaceae bacterium]